MTREELVAVFQKKMGHKVSENLHDLSPDDVSDLLLLNTDFLLEEVTELLQEIFLLQHNCEQNMDRRAWNTEALLKELADVQYTLSGFASALGLPLNQAFHRVHQSNMTKLGADGKPVIDLQGKVRKGPNYIPPIMIDLI